MKWQLPPVLGRSDINNLSEASSSSSPPVKILIGSILRSENSPSYLFKPARWLIGRRWKVLVVDAEHALERSTVDGLVADFLVFNIATWLDVDS